MIQKYLEEVLKESKVDAILISSVANITFLTGYSNFSIEEREAFMILTPKRSYLITDARYSGALKKISGNFEVLERSAENSTKKIFDKIISDHKILVLGFEEDNLTVVEYKFVKKVFRKLKPVSIHKIRIKKTHTEIELIKKACEIGDLAFEYIVKKIKPGLNEIEAANLLERFIKNRGAKMSFETIVAFAKNSSIPHHHTGETVLKDKKGQFIKMDFGVRYKNYCSDMTRTVVFGKASDKQKKIYNIVLNSQKKAVEFIENHLKNFPDKELRASEVDKVARDYIISQGFLSIPHALGHGVGVEVHEAPYLGLGSKSRLGEGSVFSIEPGIYINGFGGVRIEDLFAIENHKLKRLTQATQRLIEISS